MLGRWVADPEGVEGVAGRVPGLGYLPVDTVLTGEKRVTVTRGVEVASGTAFEGYEIHTGRTIVEGPAPPLLRFEDGTLDGAVSANGRIGGCYVHGLFNQAGQRALWLARLGAKSDGVDQSARVDESLDELASALERSVNIERIVEIARTARQ
jgi:adenosylcobyric acid synthase